MLVIGKGAKFIPKKRLGRVKYSSCQGSHSRHVFRLLLKLHILNPVQSSTAIIIFVCCTEAVRKTEVSHKVQ